jgi:hypothetical protein
MDPVLQLKHREPLTYGRSRLVFEHPDDPDLIIKVIRPEVVDERFGAKTKWYKKRRRFGRFISYKREVQEFLAIHEGHDTSHPFLQPIVGFARSDHGLGLVLEAMRGSDGKLAPNLSILIREGRFDAAAREALQDFLDQLLNCDVIISDLNPGNLVYAEQAGSGLGFVLIDGLGNNNILPFKTISRRLNRRSKMGRIRRLHQRIERAERRIAESGGLHPE